MQNIKRAGNYILLFTSLIWGMAFAFQAQGGELLTPLVFTALRMTLAAVEIGLLCIYRDLKNKNCRDKSPENEALRKNTVKAGLLCGAAMGIGVVLQQYGIDRTSAGKAGFITALYILLVPLISSLLLKQRVTRRIWAAVAIALVGMYLLCMSSAEGLSSGDLYVMGCAVFFSIQILLADHYAAKANAAKMAAIEFTLVASLSWLLAFIFEKPDINIMKQAIIPIVYCGCISGGIGYTLQLVGQRYTDPTSASLCLSFEAVFAVIAGAFMLNERMSLKEGIGCVIMFAAIVLVQMPVTKRST